MGGERGGDDPRRTHPAPPAPTTHLHRRRARGNGQRDGQGQGHEGDGDPRFQVFVQGEGRALPLDRRDLVVQPFQRGHQLGGDLQGEVWGEARGCDTSGGSRTLP